MDVVEFERHGHLRRRCDGPGLEMRDRATRYTGKYHLRLAIYSDTSLIQPCPGGVAAKAWLQAGRLLLGAFFGGQRKGCHLLRSTRKTQYMFLCHFETVANLWLSWVAHLVSQIESHMHALERSLLVTTNSIMKQTIWVTRGEKY